ncbi:MAG: DUF302 domain-containing protein [Chromatiales bacterium]
MIRGVSVVLLTAAWMLLAACSERPAATSYADLIVRTTTEKSFQDVVDELEFAISEHNFRITGENAVGKGLRERGYKDFPDVLVIHFCSLEYVREVLEIDPGYVAMMPCRITVHVQDGKTVISLILLPEDHPDLRVNAFAHRMNAVMREIMAFAIEKNASTVSTARDAAKSH